MITKTFKTILFVATVGTFLSFDLPKGWSPGGTDLQEYALGIDKGAGQDGKNAATIKSIKKNAKSGVLMQWCSGDRFLGKRVRMTGYLKSQNVVNWAGFWFRADQDDHTVSMDNMEDRVIKGTTDWKKCELVIDVPTKASQIAFGAMLSRSGQIWFDNLNFEIVDSSVPLTGKSNPVEPTNLNFEE